MYTGIASTFESADLSRYKVMLELQDATLDRSRQEMV